jgi:hypothetical protein
MKTRLSLLFASTTLAAALGLPALSAMASQGSVAGLCSGACAALLGADGRPLQPIRVSGDDDDEDDSGWFGRRHADDDDDDDEDEDDDCDDDDDDCTGARGRANPAPAGTVAPPANGLFGTGAPPRAVTN